MNILFLCPRWGNAALPSSAFIQRVLEAGYDGIEAGLAEFDPAADESIRLAQAAGLALVTQHYDTLDRDLPTHLVKFESRLRMLARYQPLFINSHTGRDLFTLDPSFLCPPAILAKTATFAGLSFCNPLIINGRVFGVKM